MKAKFHVDQSEPFRLAVGNIQNLIAYCQEEKADWEIELLLNGEAVTLAQQKKNEANDLSALSRAGVKIAVCRNAMKKYGITPQELIPEGTVVPAGVAELVLRQGQGFAYIKP